MLLHAQYVCGCVLCVAVPPSLPCYSAKNVDTQRGAGVFERSISALQQLNSLGYGRPGSGLGLDLVYNPGGAFLAPDQRTLEVRRCRAVFVYACACVRVHALTFLFTHVHLCISFAGPRLYGS